jgi:hypothetical protein
MALTMPAYLLLQVRRGCPAAHLTKRKDCDLCARGRHSSTAGSGGRQQVQCQVESTY